MTKKCGIAVSVLMLLLGSYSPVRAIFGVGDIVFDPQAFQQQMTDYVLALDQYSTQMKQYQIQFQNMQSLGYQADVSKLSQMQQVMQSAIGISNDFSRMQGQFQKTYPDFNTYKGQKGPDYAQQSTEWSRKNQQNAYDMLVVTTRLQESIAQDRTTLRSLSNRSAYGSGTKDLLQATNQLLVVNTKQLMQLQQLISTSAKADAGYLAQKASDREAARAHSKDLLRDWSKKGNYSPAPKLWDDR